MLGGWEGCCALRPAQALASASMLVGKQTFEGVSPLCTAEANPWLGWLVLLLRKPGKYGQPTHKSKETALPKPSPAWHGHIRAHTCDPPSNLPGQRDTRHCEQPDLPTQQQGVRQALDFDPSLPLHLCIPAPGSPLGSRINQMEQGLKVAQSHRPGSSVGGHTAQLRVGRGRSDKAMGAQSKPGSWS